MNIFQVQGNWNIAKGKLKQKFAQLTDDDVQFSEGKEDELIGRIQKRTGRAKTEIVRVVGECCAIKPTTECREAEKNTRLAHPNGKPGTSTSTTTRSPGLSLL